MFLIARCLALSSKNIARLQVTAPALRNRAPSLPVSNSTHVDCVAVNYWMKHRRISVWLSLAFLALALAVIGWGTGYKLSLYDAPNAVSHQMPHAKLLSKNERVTQDDKSFSARGVDPNRNPAPSALLCICFVLSLASAAFNKAAISRGGERKATHSWRLRHGASLNFFFALPPPILA